MMRSKGSLAENVAPVDSRCPGSEVGHDHSRHCCFCGVASWATATQEAMAQRTGQWIQGVHCMK